MNTSYPTAEDSPGRVVATCDVAIEMLVAALLALMPFALGVVAPWSEAAVIGVVTLIAALLAVRAFALPRGQGVGTRAFVPVALFILVCAAQLVTLPAGVVGVLSPGTLAVQEKLLADLPEGAAAPGGLSLSFHAGATRHDLRIVLACTVLFVAALQVFRRAPQYRRILWVVTISGAAAASLALLQDLSGTDKIYWKFPSGRSLASAGPFVGYSNYSQYINLCTGAALALLLLTLRKEPTDEQAPATPGGTRRRRRRSASSSKSQWDMNNLKKWQAWVLLAVVALGSVTLFLSLSRGGMLSMLIAAASTVLMLARQRGSRNAAFVLASLLLVAFVGLLYAGFDQAVSRLATLKDASDPTAGRMQAFSDMLVAWRKFPVFGTGLGTHEYVYPMFDRSTNPGVAEYADSDYFQVLEEVGAIGLALVVAFAAFIWVAYARAVRSHKANLNVIAYGLGFGLLAVMLQSWTDFGQHLPAIGGISAVFCAMMLGLNRLDKRTNEAAAAEAPQASSSRWHLARLAMPVLLVAAMGWACVGADAARRARVQSDRATAIADRLENAGWKGDPEDFDLLLSVATKSVELDPSDVKARFVLASYQWQAIASAAERDAGEDAQSVTISAAAKQKAQAVVDGLHAARFICPTYGPLYALAGQIEQVVLGLSIGTEHVRTAYALAPADADVCFAAAKLDLTQGKFDESVVKAKRVLLLDDNGLARITELYLEAARRPDVLVTAVAHDPAALFQVCERMRELSTDPDYPDVTPAMEAAAVILKKAAGGPDAAAWMLVGLAHVLDDEGDHAGAINLYRRAVKKQYGEAMYHYGLAMLLAEHGSRDEAAHEATICLRLQPQMEAARQLIHHINRRPGADAPLSAAVPTADAIEVTPVE